MAAGVLDILVEQGGVFRKTLILKNSADTPISLLGYTGGYAQIRATAAAIEVIAEITVTFDVDPSLGKIYLRMEKAITALIPTKGKSYDSLTDYAWDLYLIEPNGDPIRYLNGKAQISPGTTEWT